MYKEAHGYVNLESLAQVRSFSCTFCVNNIEEFSINALLSYNTMSYGLQKS